MILAVVESDPGMSVSVFPLENDRQPTRHSPRQTSLQSGKVKNPTLGTISSPHLSLSSSNSPGCPGPAMCTVACAPLASHMRFLSALSRGTDTSFVQCRAVKSDFGTFERRRPMNGIQQLLSYAIVVLTSCEFFHNGPLMNIETVRQLQETIALQGYANLQQQLTLPFGNIVQRFVFCQTSLFFRDCDDFSRVRVQIGNAVVAQGLYGLDDFTQRITLTMLVYSCGIGWRRIIRGFFGLQHIGLIRTEAAHFDLVGIGRYRSHGLFPA